MTSHRVFTAERGRIRNHAQRVDELVRRAADGASSALSSARGRATAAGAIASRPSAGTARWRPARERVERHEERLHAALLGRVTTGRSRLGRLAGMVESLSPLAVLGRGYALVWDASGRRLVRSAGEVEVGDALRVRLHEGTLAATVSGKEPS